MTGDGETMEVVAIPAIAMSREGEGNSPLFDNGGSFAFKRVRLEKFSAPVTLSSPQRDSYVRRFSTLFIDESRTREGSTSSIKHATNVYGEQFALKVRKPAEIPADASESCDAASMVDDPEVSRRLFEREYETHRMLSEIKGYPKLYGKALLDGRDTLVMEWIEGEDLLRASSRMAVDADGRLSPLTVARLGRDIFDVLARTNVFESEIAHGDISLRNIMLSTLNQTIDEQVQEGVFDVRLIDLSSAHVSLSAQRGGRGEESAQNARFKYAGAATPEFAAPELRSNEGVDGDERFSFGTQASDVYAVASILCLLLYGDAHPWHMSSAPRTIHEGGDDLLAVLHREPEVAVALHHAVSELTPTPSLQEIEDAFLLVDEPLEALLRVCLSEDPERRPSAREMRDALDSFCSSYTANIGRALCGETLEPCKASFINKGIKRFSLRARNLIRAFGKSVSLGLGAAVVVATAFLLQAKPLHFEIESQSLDGWSSELLVLFLLLPLLLGVLVRGTHKVGTAALVRGSIGVLAGSAFLVYLANAASFDPQSYKDVYSWAILAVSATAWCLFVLDAAFPTRSAQVRKRARGFLTSSQNQDVSQMPEKAKLLSSISVAWDTEMDSDGQRIDEGSERADAALRRSMEL